MKKYKKNIGFTLVEMLIVIAIMGILMGMLVPSLSKARKHARKVECASNLRQLYMGSVSHATDSDTTNTDDQGRFPSPRSVEHFNVVMQWWYHGWSGHTGWVNWVESDYERHDNDFAGSPGDEYRTCWWGDEGEICIKNGTLFPYIRDMRVYRCPTFERYVKAEGDPMYKDVKRSYVMNVHGGRSFFNMQKSGMSRRALFADGAYEYKGDGAGWALKDKGYHSYKYNNNSNYRSYFSGYDGVLDYNNKIWNGKHDANGNREYTSKPVEIIGDWHTGKGNVVFLDGHVECLDPTIKDLTRDICTGDYEPGKK